MDSDDLRPWEPRSFKDGDRVRVRLSGECSWTGYSVDYLTGAERVDVADHGHHPEQDGRIGTVGLPPGDLTPDPPHNISVWFDQPYRAGPTEEDWVFGASFAAVELEPLDAAGG